MIDPIARHGVLLLTDLICKVIGGGSENRPTKSSSNSTDPIFDGSGANPSRRLALPNENAIEKEATINFFASSGNVTETKVPDKISSIDKDSEIYQDEFSDEYFQDPDDDEMEMCIGIHNDLEIPPMKSYPTSNGSEIMSSSAPLNPKKIIPEQDDTIPPINVLVSKKVEKQYRSGKELDDNLVIPPPPSHSMHRPQTTVTSMHRDKNGSLADVESNEDLMISSADPNSNNRGMSSSSGFGAAAAETKSINQILQYVANGATDDALWTVSLSATGLQVDHIISKRHN